jgi:hypothetical protein
MQPHVKPLSLWRRKFVFGSLLTAFVVSLPIFIFYATGYRYDFSTKNPTFTATGGFYIMADASDSTIYIDDAVVTNARTFRSASYIQGIEPGTHRVHVQSPLSHTWVKELPVSAHIVTEAEAFNLPLVPQVRLIPEYLTGADQIVVFSRSSSTPVLSIVPTSTPVYLATSTATSTYRVNQEYTLINDLLVEQASSSAFRKRILGEPEQSFGFSTTTNLSLTEVATTTVSRDTLTLYEHEGDVFALAEQGGFRQVPHYFCAESVVGTEVLEAANQITSEAVMAPGPQLPVDISACRSTIQIDRRGQTVHSFDFFPTNTNLVLLHLDDGVYVVEIDDRAWQNMQPLYLGTDLELILYRGGIFIKEGELIFEVLPEITTT